jgi:hypothetical protein
MLSYKYGIVSLLQTEKAARLSDGHAKSDVGFGPTPLLA